MINFNIPQSRVNKNMQYCRNIRGALGPEYGSSVEVR